jgi:FixJ family two-component response regulator
MDARGQAIVYIVDDDVQVRRTERLLLESVPWRVFDFPSAEAFLADADLSAGSAHCLLLDIQLPGMSGPSLQQDLLQRDIRIPIIVQTAYQEITPAVSAMKAGAIEVLEKPINAELLCSCIAKALDQDRASRKRAAEQQRIQRLLSTLSARERQVMDGLVAGSRVKELAAALSIGTQTVLKHRASMLKKLGAKNEVQLVMLLAAYDLPPSSASRTALASTSLEKGLHNTRALSKDSEPSPSS